MPRLPIVIGVTGHRDVRPDDEPILAEAIDAIFTQLQRTYPSTPLLLLTPLAEGADWLAADVARRRSIPYRVPIPMALDKYRDDFTTTQSLARFDELLSAADAPAYAMPFFETNDAGNVHEEERRTHQYALLAAHLGRASHVMIALWDGVASPTVGGTAQAVRFRVLGVPRRYRHVMSVIDAPETGPIYHIYTPRSGANAPLAQPTGFTSLRIRRALGDAEPRVAMSALDIFEDIDELPAASRDPFETLYRRIEGFNEDCARIPNPTPPNSGETSTQSLMRSAECAASYYQKRFVQALQRLFAATGLAVLVFQIYNAFVPSAYALLILYIVVSCFAIWTYARARRGRWQDRAQDYRALEIGLNVQQAWDAAGLGRSVADYYIRRQRTELDWIRDAIRTAHAVDRQMRFDEAHAIATVRAFVFRQYAYFAGTGKDRRLADYAGDATLPGGAKRERRKANLYDACSRWSFRTSFAAVGLLLAYSFTAWFTPDVFARIPHPELWQKAFLFAISTGAIAAALFNEYPTRRAHREHARRYATMSGMYRRALDALDDAERHDAWRDPGDGPLPAPVEMARACILELGLEALSENGDWLLLHRELPIELLAIA